MHTNVAIGCRPCYKNTLQRYKYFFSCTDARQLILFCNSRKITRLIPLSIDHCLFLARAKRMFEKTKIKFLVPDIVTLNTMNDKIKFYNFMTKHNMHSYLPKRYNEIIYPCILKKNISGGGYGVYILNNKDGYTKKIDTNKYLLVEPIYGNCEYATNILAVNGMIIYTTTYKILFDEELFVYGSKKSPLGRTKCDLDENIMSVFANIIKLFNFNGVCCIDYKIINNSPIIFEINPRFGGSLIRNDEDFDAFVHKLTDSLS
jgi:carbamoylphosphate synthase large subunit